MSDVTYTFTIGPGKLERMGDYLVNSIIENTSNGSDIVVFIPDIEIGDISEELIHKLESNCTCISGKHPNPEYKLSPAHKALYEASKISDSEYLILLDTDTVLLDDIEPKQLPNGDLYLVPEFISNDYWSDMDMSIDSWKQLYDEHEFDFPERRLRSTVHDDVMLPYYNGGVIITKNNDFPKRWMSLSNELHGNLPEENYFAEMVALSLLSSEYEVQEISYKYNFPQKLHKCAAPSDTKVLHYMNLPSLYSSLNNPRIKRKLKNTGVVRDYNDLNQITKHFYGIYHKSEAHRIVFPNTSLGTILDKNKNISRYIKNIIGSAV